MSSSPPTLEDDIAEPKDPPIDPPISYLPPKYMPWADSVFSPTAVDDLPPHRPYDCAIEIEEGKSPPFGPMYRLTQDEHKALGEYLDANLKKGFIRRSTSPAASPILFVRKKTGDLRLCVDYRGLNAITKKNRYPLPHIDDLLDRTQGCKFFTVIDLKNTFNLIRIREGDEWKTAFRTPLGLYEYLVMPFGLSNAPSVFQAFIQDTLRDFLGVFCVVYLDDILIFSRTQEEHDEQVKLILDRLKNARLYANPQKCEFDKSEVEYLGYIIGADGIKMNPKKLATISEWPTPRSSHDVQIENHIAGTIVLSNILDTVQDQAEWMQGLSTLDKHFENAALDRLKCVSGAAYDSQEVADKVVSCFEGTRSALLANVGRWMSGSISDGHPPLYVLDGIAGIGKSTMAVTVAQRAAAINSLGASFCFSRDQEDRKKSSGFVHTVAYQLARYDASYGMAIAGAITGNPEALSKVLTEQFSSLVAKPLCPLLEQRMTPLVLVFDALDECVEPDASNVLKLILASVCQLPNVKVFLTTRPELGLRKKYMGTPDANVFHLQEIEDLIVEQDISLYVNYSLSPLNMQEVLGDSYDLCWQPTVEEKAKLAKLSGKLFIFASTAIKFILDSQHLDPQGQLASLLDQQSDSPSPLSKLGGLYLHVLKSAKPDENAAKWLGKFRMIVGAILVIQTPLPAMILASLLNLAEGTIRAALANLHSILAPLGKGPALTYKVHHKSFPDFITSSSCPLEFQIVEQEQHLELTKYCLEVMNKQLKFNICQVLVPSEDQYKDLDNLLKGGLATGHISKELEYAVCYWANHLSKLEGIGSDLIVLLEEFSKKHLMHWLEVLAYIKQLDLAQTMLKTALAVLVCQI
ncbi:hypothetical protein EST38_g13373 [Candolleomyces aberdarensis]|uniref:Reverse transcriptase domain-containing protein n=1 Tax=Candolleomyces aberdarensis TaxID=2316362 RepID=A0A4Q2CZZ1_9AGAR|nr:hypothetical protein EST38_g13373 [Candolleomyces aberdarensis]